MKTKTDLKLMVRNDLGHAPDSITEYINWLEEKVLDQLNKESGFKTIFDKQTKFKTTFERQMENLAKIKVKNPLTRFEIREI